MQQQNNFIAAQQFLDAELHHNQLILTQQNTPTANRRDLPTQSPNPMRLDETSPLSTGLGQQSKLSPNAVREN
jgi:hypothetical protein